MKKLLPLAVFAVMGCRDHRMIQPTLALPTPGTAVPAFAFDLRGGKQLQSSALTGRPTVLFLWSTHCPTSRRALAAYRDIQRLYTVRGVRVIMLSDDESRDELALLPKILADSGVVGDVALARGKLGAVFDRVEFVLPAYLVVDRDGRIAARSWGPDTPVVRAAIDSLLASRPAA
jgi:cytochrome oxidase Cu insertion factor (SCO1/SenC/PrrC family)